MIARNAQRPPDDHAERVRARVKSLVADAQRLEGASLRDVSKSIGANEGWLHDYLTKRIKDLSPKMRRQIEHRFGLPFGTLSETKTPLSAVRTYPQAANIGGSYIARDIPIYASTFQGGLLLIDTDTVIGYADRWSSLVGVKDVWGIRAPPDPRIGFRYKPGEILVTQGSIDAVDGDDVAVKLRHRKGWLIRRAYPSRKANALVLESFTLPAETVVVPLAEAETVRIVVGTQRR